MLPICSLCSLSESIEVNERQGFVCERCVDTGKSIPTFPYYSLLRSISLLPLTSFQEIAVPIGERNIFCLF